MGVDVCRGGWVVDCVVNGWVWMCAGEGGGCVIVW